MLNYKSINLLGLSITDGSNPACDILLATCGPGTPTFNILKKVAYEGCSLAAIFPSFSGSIGTGASTGCGIGSDTVVVCSVGGDGRIEGGPGGGGLGGAFGIVVVVVVVVFTSVDMSSSNPGIELSFASTTANNISNSVIFDDTVDIFRSKFSLNPLRKFVELIIKLFIKTKDCIIGAGFIFEASIF